MTAKWQLLGTVCVDSGLLAIQDPCYQFSTMRQQFSEWRDFYKSQLETDGKSDGTIRHQISFGFDGHGPRPGLGVVAGTAFGDGEYEVWGLKEGGKETDRTLAMIVVTGNDPALDFLPRRGR